MKKENYENRGNPPPLLLVLLIVIVLIHVAIYEGRMDIKNVVKTNGKNVLKKTTLFVMTDL